MAPRAKMNQQRARRYMTAKERQEVSFCLDLPMLAVLALLWRSELADVFTVIFAWPTGIDSVAPVPRRART